MIVSANIAICTPAEPMTAGPSVLKKPRIAGSSRGCSDPGARPARFAANQTSASSRTPAAATPQAAACPAVGNRKDSESAAMSDRLSRTGAAAAAAKRSFALSTPETMRHERDEEKIGKGDARQRDGELELLRILPGSRAQEA